MPFADHTIQTYEKLWRNNYFTYRVPYNNNYPQSIKKKYGDKIELIKTESPIKATVLTLLQIVNDDIFRPYSIIASKTPADIIVDSTKTIYWISSMLQLKELKKRFDIYLLHLVRDGRAVLNSYLKKRRNMTVKKIGDLWLKRVTNNEVFFENFSTENKILVRYEKLVTQPQAITQEICNFLGIEFRTEMLEYWKYEHHIISGNRGIRASINKYQNPTEDSQSSINSYIKLDTSWLTEMTEDTIREFYAIVADKNSPYEWDYE
ncbi:MAG: sulfotransferase [Okeania sp. SIO3B3]|nr:sulfotransferase [Okeania sp. SIO3B3]